MSTHSRIKNLLSNKQELQAITLRLDPLVINQLDEQSQTLSEISEESVSRSALIETFIKGGLEELDVQLAKRNEDAGAFDIADEPEGKRRFFLLNTNIRHDRDSHNKMLENGEASAFYEDFKEKITRLRAGDIVFLYQSGRGIVGYGIASGEVEKREYKGHAEQDYTQKLNDFVRLEKSLSAKKMKDVTKTNFNFMQTMVQLSKEQGEALLNYFKKQ